jgi:hypothetical protein
MKAASEPTKPPSMFSMPRPVRQIAACSGEGPGACEGVGAGDNGYSFLISPEITGPNSSPFTVEL